MSSHDANKQTQTTSTSARYNVPAGGPGAPRCGRHYEALAMTRSGREWRCSGPGHPAFTIGRDIVELARFGRREAQDMLRTAGVQW